MKTRIASIRPVTLLLFLTFLCAAESRVLAATQCNSSMTCVPIQPGQSIAQALAATAGTGNWTELTAGTYAQHEVDFPANSKLFCDTGVNITDVPGYGIHEHVLALHNSNITISGTCNLSMPNIYPAAFASTDFSYDGNCIDIRGTVSGITINPGTTISQCAEDGLYIREASNVLVNGITVTNPVRNAMSITGKVNGITVENNSLGGAADLANAQIADSIDVEPNTSADFITNVTISNNNLSNNQQRGLNIALWFANVNGSVMSTPVTMNVLNNVANKNNVEPYGFNDGQSGPVPHTISCSGNTANGTLIQPIQGCNNTITPPPPPPPPPPTGCTSLTFIGGSASPTTVAPNGTFTVSCDYGLQTRNFGVSGAPQACTFTAFSGTAAQFTCPAGLNNGTLSLSCLVANGPDPYCAQTNSINSVAVGSAPPPPPPPPPPPGGDPTYEAESTGNSLTGSAVVGTCATCSGGADVRFIGNGGGGNGILQFNNVAVTSAGNYVVTISYINGDTTARTALASVNGGAATSITFPPTADWSAVGTVTVNMTLNSGNNTIQLSNPTGWAPDTDKIDVAGSASTSPCDVSGDGVVNIVDVQLEVNMALGLTHCINPSGQCTIVQIQRVVNVVLGMTCITP